MVVSYFFFSYFCSVTQKIEVCNVSRAGFLQKLIENIVLPDEGPRFESTRFEFGVFFCPVRVVGNANCGRKN